MKWTPGRKAFYEMWASENRRACGCMDERDGVKVQRRRFIPTGPNTKLWWDQVFECEKNLKKYAPKVRKVKASILTPMLVDETIRGRLIVDDP